VPDGTVRWFQVVPLPVRTASPVRLDPTATQCVVLGQDKPSMLLTLGA
jgi:hypothetical protein